MNRLLEPLLIRSFLFAVCPKALTYAQNQDEFAPAIGVSGITAPRPAYRDEDPPGTILLERVGLPPECVPEAAESPA